MSDLLVQGMHGMGDCLHQRALVRQLMASRQVWLETPWPAIYHDLVDDGLKLVAKRSPLRTQAKNAAREADRYHAHRGFAPQTLKVRYSPAAVRARGSVLSAMLWQAGAAETGNDFRLPIREDWEARADALIASWGVDKPLMIYRPLVVRTEWGGCTSRNPDHAAYAELFRSIRDRFFVVSVADLAPGVEWAVGERVEADIELHAGELVFEELAALTSRAALTFAAPGFLTILAQAVGTPSVTVFGGYEDGRSFTAGAKWAPHLPIEPVRPCACFRHDHDCDKRIDLSAALPRLARFALDAQEDAWLVGSKSHG